MGEAVNEQLLDSARSAIFKESVSLEGSAIKIKGYDFNKGVNYSELMKSMVSTGFQASNLGDAIGVVNRMLEWRLSDESLSDDCSEEEKNPVYRESVRCKVFLGFTSNLISSGIRETLKYLAQHRMVDVLVTTAGGIEEDLIKCLGATYKGDFYLPGAQLRSKGLNRIGNLLVPNDNYCKFEDWIMPILDKMLEEQITKNVLWTPSRVIARLGKEINDESSYLYWAYKNNIPVYCPALTDGSLGDMLYFHSFRNPGLVVDLVQDVRAMNGEAVHASPMKTGVIILGGGLPKHHICNANMMRNGADYAVFINTAQEFDGSDSGARPDEAVSWGKIRALAESVKVHCDATIAFPLLVVETFASRGEKISTKHKARARGKAMITIWVASALHAAVNFGQSPSAGYLPDRPTVSRRFMPRPGTPEYEELKENPEKAFLKTITAQLQTLLGISLIEILSRHSSDEVYLGQRDTPEWTTNEDVLGAFGAFGKKLGEIEDEIVEMNNDRRLKNRVGPAKVPYTLLFPTSKGGLTGKGIPNSVSI